MCIFAQEFVNIEKNFPPTQPLAVNNYLENALHIYVHVFFVI